MKKIFTLIFALCVFVCSCSKEPLNTEPEMVTISFEQVMVTGNPMVRSGSNEYLDIIEELTPKVVEVTLTHKTYGNVFTCKSDESITIPKGEYKIIAEAGEDTKYNKDHIVVTSFDVRQYIYSLFKNALIYYSDTITINDNSNIVLKMSYNCCCIIGKKEEGTCYSYLSKHQDNERHLLPLYRDEYYIVFYNAAYSCERDVCFSIEVDENPYTISVYDIYSQRMQIGKYYVLHTTQVESTNNGFDMQYISMTEGEI